MVNERSKFIHTIKRDGDNNCDWIETCSRASEPPTSTFCTSIALQKALITKLFYDAIHDKVTTVTSRDRVDLILSTKWRWQNGTLVFPIFFF